ncbi:MAG: TIGR00266 family protein [Myxococcales bacterium]|nr:TIGR00266 family protein [Myxococcales bacterium]
MQYQIEHAPSYAWLRVQLAAGDEIDAEAGAMVSMTPGVAIATRLNAGKGVGFFHKFLSFFRALARKFFGGETVFINNFSTASGGEVVLAPSLSGSITPQVISAGRSLFVQRGSYLASTGNINAVVRWGGLRSFFGGEGLTLLECKGDGEVFVNSYGDVVEVPVNGTYIVDTGHIVAFENSLNFSVRKAGSMKSFLFSGEGFVCEFRGQGRLWIQSRNLSASVSWIRRLL